MGRPRLHPLEDENVKPGDTLEESSATPDEESSTVAILSEKLRQQEDMMRTLSERLARAEFAGNDKNKQRQWDEMNGEDENVKYGHLASFDGIIPVIDRKLTGSVVRDVYGNPVDSQVYSMTLLDGSERKVSMNDYVAALSGTPIYARCNNWLEYREKMAAVERKRHQFQKQGTRFRVQNVDTVALLAEIKRMDSEITMNITLSLDEGKSYTGETFDVKAYCWNM